MSTTHNPPQSPPSTHTYVLVAGAWLGGWAWDDVAPRLRKRGHRVHTPTLTGMAERADEASPDLDITTHIDDIATMLREEDLDDVILVGHSYGAAVVTGAAAKVPERIKRLIFVDNPPPPNDQPLAAESPEMEEAMRAMTQEFDGWRMPLLPDEMLTSPDLYGAHDLTAEQLATFRDRATPFPLACMTTPMPPGTAANSRDIPKTYIRCELAGPPPAWADTEGREPGASYTELRSGHWPMWSAPQVLAEALAAPVRTPPSSIDRYESIWTSTDERAQLDRMLDFHRDAVVRSLGGLDDVQATASPLMSGTSLLGLVRHLARVEYWWVSQCFAGIDEPAADTSGLTLDLPGLTEDEWRAEGSTIDDVVTLYNRVCALSRERTRDQSLDTPSTHAHVKPTLRWILLHLIEETARHAGHADILRELIDGTVGE
ncbi:hypothetical protein BH24ACT15_BH24ACT15_02310 [soil metagenome]